MFSEADVKTVIITGLSGAGRSCVMNAFEDIGFEVIDNPPLNILSQIIAERGSQRLAIGIDTRTRGFCPSIVLDILKLNLNDDTQSKNADRPYILFIESVDDVLMRRFNETRRRHPAAPQSSVDDGIQKERALLIGLREKAAQVIDTSATTPHQLRDHIKKQFSGRESQELAISIVSFSYKRGLPISADMVFDCRFLNNPYWNEELRHLDGTNAVVQDFVKIDPQYRPFFDKVMDLSLFLLPAYLTEGKTHATFALGCTGGQHRSVTMAIHLKECLEEQGVRTTLYHRELMKR